MKISDFPEDIEPRVGDIIEIEQDDVCFEVRIIGITEDGYLCEQDNIQGAVLLEGTGLNEEDATDIEDFLRSGGKIQQLPYKNTRKEKSAHYRLASRHIGGSGHEQAKGKLAGLRGRAAAVNVSGTGKAVVGEEKVRLDPKCWDGYKKQGTKMKGGVRVNNCVPEGQQEVAESTEQSLQKKIQAKRDALGLAREQRRARGQHQQGQREIKLQAEIDKLSSQLTQMKKQDVAEAGPFSYGYKPPRKGSVAYWAEKKRKEQEKGKPPIEPKDQMVGVAKVTKAVSEGEKKPHPQTWHDVDPKLGKQVDKMSQAEKVKKGLAHPDTLKKKGVAEDISSTKKKISKYEELALAANRAGDDAKCKQYQQKIQVLKQKMSQGVAEAAFKDPSPMMKDSIKQDRIRSLKNLIAVAKVKGVHHKVKEYELELKKLKETTEVTEAGAFSYGAKPPRKGSVAYNALMKRKEQDRKRVKDIEAIGTKNHHVGVAKVTKAVSEDSLEEIDRRGFLRGMGAAALGAAGIKAQAGQTQDIGDGFELATINVAGHTVKAVLDTQTNTYYTLNRRPEGNGAIIRNMAPYIFVRDGKVNMASTVGPETAAAMKKAGLEKMQEGVAEGRFGRSSYYNPIDQERREQDAMDYERRAFKRAELQHELGHEDDPDFERKMRQQEIDRDLGPWYLIVNGKVLKVGGEAKVFDWKRGANNYGLAILKKRPELQGKIQLTKKLPDQTTEDAGDQMGTISAATPDGKVKIKTAAGPYKRTKEVAQLQAKIAKLEKQGVAEGYTGRETKDGTWRVFKDGQAVAVAGPFNSRDEAHAWIKNHKQGVSEAKSLKKRVRVVQGEHAGKTGWIREIKHGVHSTAPKRYYVDIDGGGQADNLPASALRLLKDQSDGQKNMAEGEQALKEYSFAEKQTYMRFLAAKVQKYGPQSLKPEERAELVAYLQAQKMAKENAGSSDDNQFSLGGKVPATNEIPQDSTAGQDKVQAMVAQMKQRTIDSILDIKPKWERSDLELMTATELNQILRDLQFGEITEAEYQGRKVALGKPMAGDVAKRKVYVRKPNGKVVKVNFGDKEMRIKKSNPARRKSFRARHNCQNPGPKWKARYWSCRQW